MVPNCQICFLGQLTILVVTGLLDSIVRRLQRLLGRLLALSRRWLLALGVGALLGVSLLGIGGFLGGGGLGLSQQLGRVLYLVLVEKCIFVDSATTVFMLVIDCESM